MGSNPICATKAFYNNKKKEEKMAKTFTITDEQIKSLQDAAEGQLGAIDGISRIYLAPKFQAEFMRVFVEVLKASAEGDAEVGGSVDAYTKSESDNKYLAKTDAESTYQKKTEAFTQTTADERYLGKTAKAASASTADSATKATQDGNGAVIADTYAKKSELTDYVTSENLTTILEGYQRVEAA